MENDVAESVDLDDVLSPHATIGEVLGKSINLTSLHRAPPLERYCVSRFLLFILGEVVSDTSEEPPLDSDFDAYQIPHLDASLQINSTNQLLNILRLNTKNQNQQAKGR